MGAAAVAANGIRWPGHRSFVFMLGLVLGGPFVRVTPWALCASGLSAGLLHATCRALWSRKDTGWDLVALIVAPTLLAALWELVGPAVLRRGRLKRWLFPLCAAASCLILPATSQLADALAETGEFWSVLLGGGKAWIMHPLMGALGAVVGQLIVSRDWFPAPEGDKLRL
jgi:hypothetical protein